MDSELTLFTRDGCCLCDEAAAVIERAGHQAKAVKITSQIELLDRYRDSIPVLKYGDEEACWPFDETDVKRLVDS